MPNAPREYANSPIKAAAKESRDRVKDTVKKMQESLCANAAENAEDMAYLAPLLNQLFDLTLRFSEEFTRLKRGRHAADFSDIEHMALSLLVERKGGTLCRSPLAQELPPGMRKSLWMNTRIPTRRRICSFACCPARTATSS